MPTKLSVSGLRGIWNNGLDVEMVCKYTRLFLSYLKTRSFGNTIAIARDTRKTSPIIKDIVSGVARSCGFDILDIGIAPTPLLLLFVRKLDLAGGIVITASHNPPEWNALKLVEKGGRFVTQQGIEQMLASSELELADWDKVGNVEEISEEKLLNLFTDEIGKTVDVERVRNKRFKVGFDPVNGAGYRIGEMFLKYLGCEVIPINNDPTKFPQRDTEPSRSALKLLSEVVRREKCDIGFALDPDGDRLVLVSDGGEILSEEYTLPIAEISAINYSYTEEFSKKIVINLSTSSLSDWVGDKFGFEVIRTKVGEANVVQKITEEKGFIGGEGNGGVIFPKLNAARDSLVGIALILNLMARENTKVSQITSEFPKLEIVKLKTEKTLSEEEIQKTIEEISKNFGLTERRDIDGKWIKFEEGWIHIRPSNTEPVTRIIFEGMEEFVRSVSRILETLNILPRA